MGKGEQQEFFILLHRNLFFAAVFDALTQEVHSPCEFTEKTAFFFGYRHGKIALCKLLRNITQPVERYDDMSADIIQKTCQQQEQRTQYTVYRSNAILPVPDGIFNTIKRFARFYDKIMLIGTVDVVTRKHTCNVGIFFNVITARLRYLTRKPTGFNTINTFTVIFQSHEKYVQYRRQQKKYGHHCDTQFFVSFHTNLYPTPQIVSKRFAFLGLSPSFWRMRLI